MIAASLNTSSYTGGVSSNVKSTHEQIYSKLVLKTIDLLQTYILSLKQNCMIVLSINT